MTYKIYCDEADDAIAPTRDFLLSGGDERYDNHHPYLSLLPALIRCGAVVRSPILLPSTWSDSAERKSQTIKPICQESSMVIQWLFDQKFGWPDIRCEFSIKGYGKADAFVEDLGLIIEVGDTRVDKPLAALLLGRSLLVAPYLREGDPFIEKYCGAECQAVQFQAVTDHPTWKTFTEMSEDIKDDFYGALYRRSIYESLAEKMDFLTDKCNV